ncbi:beta-lactamase family protein [Aquihabitans sp. G128]|uniref:serine hydrolase n=1 Tax=Aquihabitans sp. G128 TaxID=2849779 RepID=UPI001C21A5E9|nr:serine hydrolase [Aquihabitans sp. G128]QXC61357.1 beta-lactamase family protein [Aquihabitans sp. G128]
MCREGLHATSGQVSFRGPGGERADLAVGPTLDGRPLTTRHLAEVFCLTKPIVAMAALLACERAGVDGHRAVGEIVPGLDDEVAAIEIAAIVNHDAGLMAPPAFGWMTTKPDLRPGLGAIRRQAGAAAYSEISGWRLLAAVIERLTGQAAATFTGGAVLGPLGLDDHVCLSPAAADEAEASDRLLLPIGGLPRHRIPMLHLRSPAYRTRLDPVLGGLANAASLATVGHAIGSCVRGHPVDGLPSPSLLRSVLARRRRTTFDQTWQRRCGFALAMEVIEDDAGAPTQLRLTAGPFPAACSIDLATGAAVAMVLDGGASSVAETEARFADLVQELDR